MSVEFVDTNVLLYAHDASAISKSRQSIQLLSRLIETHSAAVSIQILAEFYAAVTTKLKKSAEYAEEIITDLGSWAIHRPAHSDILSACRLQRRYRISWWDALVVNSAIQLDASVLWTEDLADGQRYGTVTVRNPFR